MPNYAFTLANWSDNSAVGSKAWINPGNAQVLDSEYAGAAGSNTSFQTHYLQGEGPSVTSSGWAADEVLMGIELTISRFCAGEDFGVSCQDDLLYLVAGGTVLSLVNFASASPWSDAPIATVTYAISSAQLATLGVDKTAIGAGFGVAFSVAFDSPPLSEGTAMVDQIAGTFYTIFEQKASFQSATLPALLPGIGIRNL